MDPIVDDPTKCHWHSADANRSKWPTVEEIIEYKEKTRKLIIENILKVLECKSHMMAHKGKVFHMVKEHTEMVKIF